MIMINLLLADTGLIIGLSLVGLAIVAGIILAIRLSKKVTNNAVKVDWNKYNGKGQLKKHTPILWPKELEFYYMFRSVLPKEFMIIPKMGMDEIVKPNGKLVFFNAVKDLHVNFCIAKVATMEPIAVLDTYYPSITDSTIQQLPIQAVKALESVDTPVIKYEILDVPYNKEKVLKRFLEAIDPVSLAQLQKKN